MTYGTSSHTQILQIVNKVLITLVLVWFAANGTLSFDYRAADLSQEASSTTTTQSEAPGRSYQNAIALAVMTTLILSRLTGLKRAITSSPGLVILPAYAITSAAWSQDPYLSAINGARLLIATLFAAHLAVRFSPVQIMRLLIAAGSLFALLNIFFAIFLPEFGTELAYYEYSWRGITAFKNVCGYSTVFFIAPALFLKPKSSLHRAFLSGYVAAHILVLYFTKSRTAWLMLLGMVATRYVVRLSKTMEWRKYQSVLLSICMIASLALPVGQPIVAGIAAAIGKDPSLNGRTNVWASIAEALYKRPVLGYGFHAFWLGLAGESGKIMTSGRWYPGFAHNGFLEIWLELGIVGVVGMSVITVRNMIVGIRQLKVDYTEQNCWYICITVITVICNLAEGTLLSAANLSWMIFVIAWVGLANERKRSRHRTVVATSYQPTLVRRAV